MGVKERIEAATKALGPGSGVFESEKRVNVLKSVYWCDEGCGGIGCRMDICISISKKNGATKVFVNGFNRREIEKLAEREEDPCVLCLADALEHYETLFYENL